MTITVLGGGNGSLADAAELAEAGHEARLWRRDTLKLEAIAKMRNQFVVWAEGMAPGTADASDKASAGP